MFFLLFCVGMMCICIFLLNGGNEVIMKYLISDVSTVNGRQFGGLMVVCMVGRF